MFYSSALSLRFKRRRESRCQQTAAAVCGDSKHRWLASVHRAVHREGEANMVRKMVILCRKMVILCRKMVILCRKMEILCRKIVILCRKMVILWRKMVTSW